MHIRVPPKRTREKFFIIYELYGCQKAVNFLTDYYGVRKMKIILNGKKVGNGYIAYYFKNEAFFTKRGLKKRTVLHELYHHLIKENVSEMPIKTEEKEANKYAKEFLTQSYR